MAARLASFLLAGSVGRITRFDLIDQTCSLNHDLKQELQEGE